MSRNVSDTLKSAVFASETAEVFILLLTISHPNLATPIRVSSDSVDTPSRGNTFVAYPFEMTLPTDGSGGPPRCQLSIDNIDRMIIQNIRSIGSSPSVDIEIVLASALDTVEASFPAFNLREVRYDALVVEGEITLESFLGEPYPAALFSPADFPGLF